MEGFQSLSYVTQNDLNLEKVADKEPWRATDHILELVPNADKLEIELITQESKLTDINTKLLKEKNVGLIVMGPVIHRKSKPSLIILTTRDKFYAIDPNDVNRGVMFLKMKLKEGQIQFWTTDGLNESDCLYHNYNIDLTKSRANCCTGVHVHMMQSMQYKADAALMMYPYAAIRKSRAFNRIERFDTLVEIWLDIDRREMAFDTSQMVHLKTRPLSLTAINIIKKRCILVLPLAHTLEYHSWQELHFMCQTTFDRLISCNKLVRQAMIAVMKKSREKGEADIGYYAHFNGGVSSWLSD